MKLNKNTITALVAAGVISSVANADQSQQELSLDQKANSKIEQILSDSQSSESEKLMQINIVMKKVSLAKEFQSMELQELNGSNIKAVGGMTCGDYNL